MTAKGTSVSKKSVKSQIEQIKEFVYKQYDSEVENHKRILKEKLESSSLTLCIGAGVTKDIIGTWNELLNQIASTLFYHILINRAPDSNHPYKKTELKAVDINHFLDELWPGFPKGTNVLELGEYLAAQCDRSPSEKKERQQFLDPNDFSPDWRELFFAEMTLDASRRLIWNKIAEVSKNKTTIKNRETDTSETESNPLSDLEEKFIKYYLNALKNKESFNNIKTLDAIVRLCFSGAVNHIINYNFDSALELLLSSEEVFNHYHNENKKFIPVNLSVINPFFDHGKPIDLFAKPSSPDCHTIHIVHVHGLLDKRLETISPIVFSERSYVNIKRATLHWSSVAIANAVAAGVMLCVGFSGDDNDFRTICQRIKENEQLTSNPASLSAPHIYLMSSLNSCIRKITDPLENQIEEKTKSKKATAEKTESAISIEASGESKEINRKAILTKKEMACTYEILLGYVNMVENYFRDRFDVQTIWVKDHKYTPDFIKELIEK